MRPIRREQEHEDGPAPLPFDTWRNQSSRILAVPRCSSKLGHGDHGGKGHAKHDKKTIIHCETSAGGCDTSTNVQGKSSSAASHVACGRDSNNAKLPG